ncbi:MAG: hypothetical protein KGO02_21765 [Alphaproteobacteria bacterium]|nr:hypothetical protein [Alphaproteobacteria bacterium]
MPEHEDAINASCAPCRGAVTRVYRELRTLGYDDPSAFRSAVTVLSLRHPGLSREAYAGVAAAWIEAA